MPARFDDMSLSPHEQNFQDIMNIICLTRRHLLPPQALVDEPAQLTETIGPEEDPPRTNRDRKIRLENVGPLYRKRAQPPVGAGVGHAVAAPVVAHGQQSERLSAQRMKGMGDERDLAF